MIKVLHVMSSIGTAGGVQSLIWNYYKHMDKNKIHFDFGVFNGELKGFEKGFVEKGSRIYFVTPKRNGLIKHCRDLKKAMSADKYDVVHVHQDYLGFVTLFVAKICGIKTRIIHTHKANLKESKISRIKRYIFTLLTCAFATDYFACGIEAAKWTFGEKKYNKGKVYILNNAIELDEYVYDNVIREKVRNELKLKDNIVIGNIARFTYQKNHELLIDIFDKLHVIEDNYRLMLVGEGENFDKIKKIISEKGLENAVLMLGDRNDVKSLLQAMDVFVLTSRFEGLPVTLIEAQSNGLPCVVSSTTTKEVNVTGQIVYARNDLDINEWVEKIDTLRNNVRIETGELLKNSGFNITDEAGKLIEKYRVMIGHE